MMKHTLKPVASLRYTIHVAEPMSDKEPPCQNGSGGPVVANAQLFGVILGVRIAGLEIFQASTVMQAPFFAALLTHRNSLIPSLSDRFILS
jgi:hypothetical protein